MDAYQKVLVKLYEETGGRETKQVDFAAMLKKMGFFTSFNDILTRLNREGWIADAPTASYVFITHWGAMEAKKTLRNEAKAETLDADVKRDLNRLSATLKELSISISEFSSNISAESLEPVEKKSEELATIIKQIKSNF